LPFFGFVFFGGLSFDAFEGFAFFGGLRFAAFFFERFEP
jgi:hypothetical protein